MDGTTTMANISTSIDASIDPASTITYAATNTATNIPDGTYGKLIIEGTTLRTLSGYTTLKGDAITSAPLNLSGTLNLAGGSLNMGNNNLSLTTTGAINGGSATSYIKLGTGKLVYPNVGSSLVGFPIGTATSYAPVTIKNDGTVVTFSVGVSDGITGITSEVVNKTWDITPNAPGAIMTLTVKWLASDHAPLFSATNCVLSHFDTNLGVWENKGTSFGPANGSGTAADPYYLTRSDIRSFSPFAVGGPTSPLPVSLTSFTAVKKNAEVALAWETASEKNNTGFEVQASFDGKNYEAIGFVASQNGNANTTQRYAYAHKIGSKEGLVYYRLKQVDLDGTSEYYTAKVVDLGRFNTSVNTFPNPFQNNFELNLTAATAETAQIIVTDMAGKTVYQTTQKLQKGANTLNVEIKNQPAGLYLLKATTGNQTYTNRLVKQ